MGRRNDFLDRYRYLYQHQEDNQHEYKVFKKVIQKMLDHFVIEDKVHNTNHFSIIYDLYINAKVIELETIAVTHFIDVRTLERYRLKYEKYAKVFKEDIE